MRFLSTIIKELPEFKAMENNLAQNITPSLIVGGSDIHKAHFILGASETKKPILVITPDENMARRLVEDINSLAGVSSSKVAYLYPTKDFSLRLEETASREYEQLRLFVLSKLQNKDIEIVCCCAEALLQHTIPPACLKDRHFVLDMKKPCKLEVLKESLIRSGYEKREQVEGVAQFCIRGGIVDIFPVNCENPIRLELWGDEIDTMAFFDLETQRRTDSIKKIEITPAAEVLFESTEELKKALEALISKTKPEKQKEKLTAELSRLESGILPGSYDKYIALAYEKPATLFDYFNDGVIFVSEYQDMRERIKTYLWQQQEDQKQLLEEGLLTKALICFDEDMPFLLSRLQSKDNLCVFMDTFGRSNQDMRFADLQSGSFVQNGSFSGEQKMLIEEITSLIEQEYAVIIMAGTKKAANTLASDLKQAGFNSSVYSKEYDNEAPYKRVVVMSNSLSSGFEYPDIKVSVITTVGTEGQHAARRDRYKKGKQLKSLTDLAVGDLVVHISHGIGVFEGIKKLEMQGLVKDYIKISYAGSDVLYVPVVQLDLVSKYIGARDDGKVKLNKLHSTEWQNTRRRVKQAVADMADELIKLYASRMEAKGFSFGQDTEWQKDFEQHFPYVETDDQLRCVDEIKADMELGAPMDRVLCGDVGFGKTEVAMRACFKAVMDSKQVAVLCPTTILAWQHFQSFTKRFEGFPINIEVLSRFRTPKQQKEILKRLKAGLVDIIIGTHRIVQKDVFFKDLGLAVIDEEQRFGVAHKERFKAMFNSVDMLTLSATPIPRTLNMAISGIRDMSTIEQAPSDRHPVQTYVLEYDKGIVMDAIRRELRRGGQCYYIHNKIETIEQTASAINSAIPEAKVAFAHGRMDEKQLSEIWRQLVEHEIDVLVCTTIIETGVDVPNCNTLIIDHADHMGLSQLYQLRGRVGRSGRRAFAYFTFTRGKILTEISAKRLAAIREFTKFGSGFHIALRDLEIRGAGSILGGQQHGHMEAVGYDMYIRLLSEAIAERKGEKPDTSSHECLIDLKMDAHIPENYIETTAARIDIYKKIASVKTQEDKSDITDELIDRFGEPPTAVLSLLQVAMLRNALASFGFDEISEKASGIMMYQKGLDMEMAGGLVKALPGRVFINASSKPYISVKSKKEEKQTAVQILTDVVTVLNEVKTQ